MPALAEKFGIHFTAFCSNCRTSQEVCARRLDGEGAKRRAVEIFRKAGWHVDGLGTPRERWFCPGRLRKRRLLLPHHAGRWLAEQRRV